MRNVRNTEAAGSGMFSRTHLPQQESPLGASAHKYLLYNPVHGVEQLLCFSSAFYQNYLASQDVFYADQSGADLP